MRPESLYLKGFKGIRAGMGRDEVRIDLTKDVIGDREGQLIAITGGNGAGKTTVMDNLQPYRIMPSHAKTASVAAFSYYDHLCLPECIKELTFWHAGKRYRSTLVFRVNGVRKVEAYLHVDDGGQWRAVTLPDGTVSDGKASTHDACVEWLLGKPETFFTSVFAAQGRRNLSTYSAGEMKSLMVDLLGLEQVRAVGEKANQVCKGLRNVLDDRRTSLRAMGDVVAKHEQAQRQLREADIALKAALLAKERGKVAIDGQRQRVAMLQRDLDASADSEARRDALLKRRDGLHARRNSIEAKVVAVKRRELARKEAALGAQQQALVRIADRRQSVVAEKQAAEQLLATRALIEAAGTRVNQLADDHRTLEATVLALEQREMAAKACKEEGAALQRAMQSVKERAGQAVLRAEGLRKRLGLTMEVPCAGMDLQGRCKLLGDANAARTMVPSADAEIATLQAQYETLQVRITSAQANLQAFQGASADLLRARKSITELQRERVSLASLAARRDMLTSAVQVADRSVGELSALDTQERDAKALCAKQRAECDGVIRAALEEANTELAEVANEDKDVASKMKVLPAATDRRDLTEAQDALQQMVAAELLHEKTNSAALVHETTMRGYVVAAEADREAAAKLGEMVIALEQEIGWWHLLAKACGSDGVIALCIDDAGPELARLTNELLLACYGPRFTVSIVTQVETAKKELREGFDITVFDSHTGDAKSVEVMSGGERVWINETLARAIALYLANQHGGSIKTLFSDEADGPLDCEHKRMFMAMKREVLRLGGYEREFYISQTPELAAMADGCLPVGAMRASRQEVVDAAH
jgi:DNA repair protein SbcC/Rad50